MRSLQLALRSAPDAAVPQVIQMTSAVPDEGKTALVLNPRDHTCAQTGARVLEFELDLRRPSIPKRSWSHADGTATSTPLFSEPRHDPRAGIDLILVRNPPRRPEAVPTSPDLADLMRRLHRRYDHIVVDSVALLDARDAKLPGQLVDTIILAVRWQSTSVELVRAARDEPRRGAVPLLGAVLTQVEFQPSGAPGNRYQLSP